MAPYHHVAFNDIEFLADSSNYELIEQAIKNVVENKVEGMCCEIGTRSGGSLAWLLNSLVKYQAYHYRVVCVDPWGSIQYNETEIRRVTPETSVYSNQMRKELFEKIYIALNQTPLNVLILPMEDTEFMNRFPDYVPFYDGSKERQTCYSYVLIDGPHDIASVMNETHFFLSRLSPGGYLLYDDVGFYEHDRVHNFLLRNGFTEAGRGHPGGKILYKFGSM